MAGGGGASTGIERALGRPVDVAINHDPQAVVMHAANHPATRHFCQSIMAVDPLEATGGAPVALAWFSPDCKHHSKAKGGKPREKNIRDLAWVVVHWAERLRKATPGGRGAPAVIMLENVEEFRQWGPLDAAGKPIPERRGEEFDLWVRGLRRQGYRVEWRELRACDFGAPTSRKRLFLIARRDGRPIVWPVPTHGKPGSPEVARGERLPWRSAAECIDWSIPCPSIFDRARPLKEATNRRIAHGVMRYVVQAARPFVVGTAFTSTRAARVFDPQDPLRTATSQREYGVVDAAIVPITHTGNGSRSHDPAEPLRTVTTANGGEFARATATIAPIIVGAGGPAYAGKPKSAGDPLGTVMVDDHKALSTATMVQMGYGEREGQAPRALDLETPLGTVVASGAKHGLVTAFLSTFYTNGGKHSVEAPAPTIMAGSNKHTLVCAHMEQANTGRIGHPADVPVSTIMGCGVRQQLVETTLVDADALPPAMLDRAVRVAAFLVKYYGNEVDGHGLDQPIATVTTKDRFAVITVTIDAITYVIVDIGLRMLTPRELARAQGFPDSYDLECVAANGGKPLTKSSQIAKIGNSVCPDVAEALVRANVAALFADEAGELAA